MVWFDQINIVRNSIIRTVVGIEALVWFRRCRAGSCGVTLHLLLGPAGLKQTSAKITAAPCLPSALNVWFSVSPQTSSWVHSERWPRGSEWTSGWEQPRHRPGPAAGFTSYWTSEPNDGSGVSCLLRPGGPHTLLHSCPVQMVKYLSNVNASARPIHEWFLTVGLNIPEVVR